MPDNIASTPAATPSVAPAAKPSVSPSTANPQVSNAAEQPPVITKKSIQQAAQNLGKPSGAVKQPTEVTQPKQVANQQAGQPQRNAQGQFVAQPPQQQALGRPGEGNSQVDFNQIADPVVRKVFQDRFNRLYRQVKGQDKNFENLTAHNQALEKALQELRKEQVIGTARQQFQSLEQQAAQAYQSGDWVTLNRLQRDMAALEAQDFQAPPIEVPKQSTFDKDEENYILQWAQHQSRPWTREAHPLFDFAKEIGFRLCHDKEWRARGVQEIFHEVDRIMNVVLSQNQQQRPQQQQQRPAQQQNTQQRPAQPQQRPQQQVLSGNQNARPQQQPQTINLSNDEKRVAERMFWKGGLVNGPRDAWKMYHDQKQLIGRS